MPRYLFYLLLLTASLTQLGCLDDEVKPGFDMIYSVDFTLPAGLNTVERHYFEFYDVETDFQAYLAGQGYTLEDIERIEPTGAVMYALSGDSDYGDIFEVSVQVFNGQQSYVEAFFRQDVPPNATDEVNMLPTLANFKEYLEKPTMQLRVRLDLRQITSFTTDTRLDMSFRAVLAD